MIARNKLLLNLINEKSPQEPETETNNQNDISVGPMEAPEPEQKTPQEKFKEIIKASNKKVKGVKKMNQKRKKAKKDLIELMEEMFQPVDINDAEIF